ncbi:MAG: hypothetical protein WCZ90_07800 [Melioribacteraceae bacterium]
MGFVGNRKGPRKSEIVSKLGATYFGISGLELAKEIELYIEEERAGEIDPVRIDENGKIFLLFYNSNHELQRYYLDSNAFKSCKKIKAIVNNEEKEIKL